MKGEQGPQGEIGFQGPPGEQGPQGDSSGSQVVLLQSLLATKSNIEAVVEKEVSKISDLYNVMKFEEQQKLLDETLKMIDEKLMVLLNQSMEAKKQAVAKKKKWWKFWS
ncbi:collagen-like protein [Cytobacillus sp. IB215665]|uniref:collagen-like triple helix repeat-containing protein n=1 Tax=Cytobacillus sp. IB215665 TaxID=3097357 RepID=UPI002A0C826F|nr:collagen-like protein [Cytobacillus sp. IB215665]MDX8367119.1 collagen-like protein [Cytobacillus sp. IB215665]